YFLSSGVCSGQPSVENGHKAEENQVSSTSGSWINSCPPQFGQCVGGVLATIGLASKGMTQVPSGLVDSKISALQPLQYQAGIWWPHQIWREMHQSLMSRIQPK